MRRRGSYFEACAHTIEFIEAYVDTTRLQMANPQHPNKEEKENMALPTSEEIICRYSRAIE